MAWPVFMFRWPGFSRFSFSVMVLDWITLTLAVCILLKAIDIRVNTGHFINMVSNKDGDVLPILLAIVAVLAIPIQVVSIGLHLKLIYGVSHDCEAGWLRCVGWGSLLVATCSMVAVLASCLVTRRLQDRARNGIVTAMHEYSQGKEGSRQIDLLQTRFQCCGSASYREWFGIRWDSHMREKPDEEHMISDDVPYSCCLQSAMSPCIHNNIKSTSNVYVYDPRHDLMISKVGCHESVVAETRRTVLEISIVLGALIVLEVLLAACRRVEQTAMGRSPRKGGKDIYKGWIFGT